MDCSDTADQATALHRQAVAAQREGRVRDAVALFQQSLALRKDLEVYLDFGALLAALPQWAPAGAVYAAALKLAPGSPDAHYGLAVALHAQGRPAEAEPHYRAVLAARPDLAELWNNLGVALQEQNRSGEAEAAFREALSQKPREAGFWKNLGVALEGQDRRGEAAAAYREALARDPQHAVSLNNLGGLALAAKRLEEARAAGRRMAALNPADRFAWMLLGNAAHVEGRWAEAVRANAAAVRLAPEDPGPRNNLANALAESGLRAEAVAEYRAVLAHRPDFPVAEVNLAEALRGLRGQRDLAEAEAVLRGLIGRNPQDATAWRVLGLVWMDRFRPASALDALRRAVVLAPGDGAAWHDLGSAATLTDRVALSVEALRRRLRVEPEHAPALAQLVQQQKRICDWRNLEEREARLVERLRGGAGGVPPFGLLSAPTTLADQRVAAERWARQKARGVPAVVRRSGTAGDGRLRIGYLSADFREHAVAHLMVEALERHDRAGFAVTAYSMGADDASPMRRRLTAAVERFVDVRDRSDAEAARLIAADGIDILVDLQAYTVFARTPILAARPAPVQVNWLGYPGTMGADFIDVILADAVTIPPGEEGFYSEAVVRLPHCYQPNDRHRAIAERTPSRADCGLPEDGFVFCCFNSPYKLTPALFDVWARLLRAVPGSVLWLFAGDPLVAANLRREAERRGVAPDRLVVAPPLPQPEHLARHRLAGLFLDTLPYNAHTTASDALWAGLPVVTCQGPTFAGRVASSLLKTLGLPELVTDSLAAYEALALGLARDPDRLAGLKARLAAARTASPMFDGDRFARDLEDAYRTIWQRFGPAGDRP
ncbi:putative O-linked N-acetylglucosamine transferase (SPINDLY family) [Azospirillum brasilense]|uniref:protein O-GlcNAc transferase n=1 Tax=Azospirillum brasilense TaxID=192 RepID=A0A560ANV4_AZOBR|nr:tetratricopeptide repeat protein [Azospirillum brasilense]TWA62028.1 putative O-linked N-acetylglucosamine transferase (SPINDLY family) [Azospirillum brasilense]